MRIFRFMRMDWLKRQKMHDEETMVVPLNREGMPPQVELADRAGNGSFVDERLIAIREPYSMAAEQYRVLCTRISQLAHNSPSYAIAMTSSVKAEGKSFTSLNLAITLSKDFDERVLLIEGDLKNPTLHEYLRHPPGFGLSDILEGKLSLDACSIHMFEGKLSVVLAGKTAGNPSRLLSSNQMQELLKSVRGEYKYIIIDTPPIIPMADINIYATLVDSILLVIQAGRTPKSVVKRALSTIQSEKVIGAVLNEVETNYPKYYYGSRYRY